MKVASSGIIIVFIAYTIFHSFLTGAHILMYPADGLYHWSIAHDAAKASEPLKQLTVQKKSV